MVRTIDSCADREPGLSTVWQGASPTGRQVVLYSASDGTRLHCGMAVAHATFGSAMRQVTLSRRRVSSGRAREAARRSAWQTPHDLAEVAWDAVARRDDGV